MATFLKKWAGALREMGPARVSDILSIKVFVGLGALIVFVDGMLIGLAAAYIYASIDGTVLPDWFDIEEERSLPELWDVPAVMCRRDLPHRQIYR